MTATATDIRAILARMDRESAARLDEVRRRYAPQPVSRWWWLAVGGFLLVCTAAGGTFGWVLTGVLLQPGGCH